MIGRISCAAALAAALLVSTMPARAADTCEAASAKYVESLVRESRLCLLKGLPSGGTCAGSNRTLDKLAAEVRRLCAPGTEARLACTARTALEDAGLPTQRLFASRLKHLCMSGTCGNGSREASEQCDDANLSGGDGCSAICRLEGGACSNVCTGVVPVSGETVRAERVASGLSMPLFVTAPPGDVDRVFIVEQTGTVRILRNGVLLDEPFLDLSSGITCCGESGLLGLAFHPDYARNGRLFAAYTDEFQDVTLAEFRVSPDPDLADPASLQVLLTINTQLFNHNGGWIGFGPGGLLFFAVGDGGGGGDPFENAQNTASLQGKILRIDVDAAVPYATPASNPFTGRDDAGRDEIWALGLRNPWRASFDRLSADMYIGDVGEGGFEEIDYLPAPAAGGANFGWDVVEGNGHCFEPSSGCDTTGFTPPIHEYARGPGCASVIGGYVYRGCRMPDLQGHYFWGDFCGGYVKSFRVENGVAVDHRDWTEQLESGGEDINLITSFGEDARGEIYITDIDGEVFRIVPGG